MTKRRGIFYNPLAIKGCRRSYGLVITRGEGPGQGPTDEEPKPWEDAL